MTTAYATKVIPLDEAIAALDSPEAVADRKKRAAVMAKGLVGDARNAMLGTASGAEIEKAQAPIRRAGNTGIALTSGPPRQSVRDAEREVGRNYDELCYRQCLAHLRRMDEIAIVQDPDRMEAQRNWLRYAEQVSAAAYQQGNKSDAWIAKWKAMIEERQDAGEFGDPIGPIDRRLERHVGVPYPQAPEASWASADTLGKSERQTEYDRLEQKYGPRTSATDTPATGRRVRK